MSDSDPFTGENEASTIPTKNMEEESGSSLSNLELENENFPLESLPTKQYLESTVIPILIEGLSFLARERPSNPVEYLAAYLLKHNPQKEQKE